MTAFYIFLQIIRFIALAGVFWTTWLLFSSEKWIVLFAVLSCTAVFVQATVVLGDIYATRHFKKKYGKTNK